MRNAPHGGGALQVTAGQVVSTSVPHTADETDRPRCRVVGVYCEALGWLRREPVPAAVCCRHYWAGAVAS